MPGIPSSDRISTKLQRIAELAREAPTRVLLSLHHNIDFAWMAEAYRRTRKDGAPGVDRETAEQFEADLEANLQELLEGLKSGRYRAPAVRRVLIPKGDGRKTRPIGIPTLRDKVLQRAVAMVLEAIYEQDFLDCSYGFRPGRSAHQALDDLWQQLMKWGGAWIVELDIQSFFDTIDHTYLRSFLDQRVRDGVIRRAIDKWLNAGVLAEGKYFVPETGTPQGGVISPILANIYLHGVLDRWFQDDVLPRLSGAAFMLRYADDAILCFRTEADARKVLEVLPKRFGRFGLNLHPEKTRLVSFQKPPDPGDAPRGSGHKPETFDLLGFTHHWALSRRGQWIVRKRTAKSRLRRALQRANEWCRFHRHLPIRQQHTILVRKITGHMAYYGITGNGPQLSRFVHVVRRLWRKWLARRNSRHDMNWQRYTRLLMYYPLPGVRIVHSYRQRVAR